MTEIILFFIFMLIIFTFSKNSTSVISKKLDLVLLNNNFKNKKIILTTNSYQLITADSHGENYLFALKRNAEQFNIQNISSIYDIAQKNHIHKIVLINSLNSPISSATIKVINKYNIDVWNLAKLNNLAKNNSTANTSKTTSILKTSNTSDDKCKIDTNSYEPIQDATKGKISIFKNIFQKPDRL